MNHKAHSKAKLFLLFLLLYIGILFSFDKVHAATHSLTVNNNETSYANVNAKDTGNIIPNLSFIEDQSALKNFDYSFECYNTDIIQIDNFGNFTAVNPGRATVYIRVYSTDFYYTVFSSTLQFTVGIDMTNVTLSADNVSAYMYPEYYYMSKPSYSNPETTININSEYLINSDNYYDYNNYNYNDNTYYNSSVTNNTVNNVFSYTCSNPLLQIEASVYNNVITITQYSDTAGSCQIFFIIYGKTFTVNYQSTKLDISKQSCLIVKGKKKQLFVSGYSGNIEWISDNPSIATVNSHGIVKGKKIGNVIIKAKIGDQYLGCAVSVTKAKLKKVVERATFIGTHWKYSQEKRTQKGYYDCSALVWKAYKEKAKVTFGSPYYPGVALTEAKWCKSHNKMLKGGITYKKVIKMQINPGDLLFKSTDMKKKYADIYHVEMFTGYFCHSVNSDGTANYSPIWAARGTYYSWEEGSLLGRPIK